jgi:predicted nucleic acid-binding protein
VRFVLDNTIAMAWCFAEEATEFTEALLDRLSNSIDVAVVPDLWLYEVVNVTELAARKGRISTEQAEGFVQALADLPIEFDPTTREGMFGPVRALVRQYQLTAYDASYLDLAIRQSLPIASFDIALLAAAKTAGVGLVQT